MKIIARRRSNDVIAFFEGHEAAWALGRTTFEAVGNLFLECAANSTHREMLECELGDTVGGRIAEFDIRKAVQEHGCVKPKSVRRRPKAVRRGGVA